MAFTEKKFESLSRINKFKKTIFTIREYLAGRKSLAEAEEMFAFFYKYADSSCPVPASLHEWALLSESLLQTIEEYSEFIEERPFDASAEKEHYLGVSVLIDNIRSPHNTGSIIRTAEALGADEVLLAGITPGMEHAKTQRTAMHAQIHIERVAEVAACIDLYRQRGYRIIAIEKTRNSADISTYVAESRALVIVGNEEFGISDEVLARADLVLHIPLGGGKNSLNVSVAAGVALYVILNKTERALHMDAE